MFDFLFDGKTRLRTVRHILIALTIFIAAQHIFDYQLYRTEWHKYYEIKLKRNGFNKNMAENLSKIMFIAKIIGTSIYNIIFIFYIVKEILVFVVLFTILELALLIYSLLIFRVKNPNTSVLTGLEFLLWTLQVMVGIRFCYLLKQKINENKKSLEVEPHFPT